jgi:Fic family protein
MWIWQSSRWPRVAYDAASMEGAVRAARDAAVRVLAKAEALTPGDRGRAERDVWAEDAVATAAIEGESLPLASVRSSVARRLGLPPENLVRVPRPVDGLLDVLENAVAAWDQPLTSQRLCAWQASLFPEGVSGLHTVAVGRFRRDETPMQIVSGPLGRERVHYEAPPGPRVDAEMDGFIAWFNDSRSAVDGVLRAGLAHLYFEAIHPFEDGNGRVGRAICDLAFAQDARLPTRLLSVSAEFRRRQREYYDALNAAQRGDGEVTPWLAWFVDAFARACSTTAALIDGALDRSRFWVERRDLPFNARQRKVLGRMLEAGPGGFEGGLTTRKYQGMTGASRATATRDITELVASGVLVRGRAAGRSTYYDLAMPGWAWRPPR